MFIVTARLKKGRLLFGLGLGVLLCAAAFAGNFLSGDGAQSAVAVIPSPKGVKTAEDRIAYLEGYGWLVKEEPIAIEELLIPEELDESYTQYIALQNGQGFELEKYCGKRVKRYTYEITNYPTGETGVQVGILLYKNTVVGGEVLSVRSDGFVHGLTAPE